MRTEKSRTQLNFEYSELTLGRDLAKVHALMAKQYRVISPWKLTLEQFETFVAYLKGAVERGEL